MNPYRDLNGMQKMMLRWEAFHPLNAVHIVEFCESITGDELERAVRRAARSLALRPIEFSPRLTRCRFVDVAYDTADEFPSFEKRHSTLPLIEAINSIARDELNRPFADGQHWPWRFVQIEAPSSPTCLLLSYQHAVTDARGASLVLREITRLLYGQSTLVGELQTDLPSLSEMFPADYGIASLPRRIAATLDEFASSTTCHQVLPQVQGPEVIIPALHAHTVATAKVKEAAHANGGTVQDLLFAALFEGVEQMLHDEISGSTRQDLAIRSMVDLRREAPQNVDLALSQILGCMTVRLRVDPGITFPSLMQKVVQQTRTEKESKQYRSYSAKLETMARLWDYAPDWINRSFSPRAFPAVGMISNLNLTDFLAAEIAAKRIQNYYRLTGTGPLSPLMLSVTSLGPILNVVTTHHGNKYRQSDIEWLGSHITNRLTEISPDLRLPSSSDVPQNASALTNLRPAA